MTSSICGRLIKKKWKSFISDHDLGKIPEAQGIYTIGLEEGNGDFTYLYVGYSEDMHNRLRGHKWGKLHIDKFIKKQIKENDGKHLKMKWVEDEEEKCNEGEYIECMARKLEYWPEFNMKRGNSCS